MLSLDATTILTQGEVCIDFEKAAPETIKSIKLKSDGSVLCLGTHKNNGSVIIVDEGIVGNAIAGEDSYKIGGWGFPHSDVGSFPWIGLEAIRLTLQWIDGYIESSSMIEAIYKYFDGEPYKIVQWAMKIRQTPDEYRVICDIVLHYLRLEDPYAKLIIKKTASEVDRTYQQLQQNTKLDALPCYLYGYIAPFVTPFLSENTKKNITHPNGNGIAGALRLIRSSVHEKANSIV